MARVVWLSLLLVHQLLSMEQHSADSSQPVLMAVRGRAIDGNYLATLFSYLDYPYHTGLARSAVAVLKWLMQVSGGSSSHHPLTLISRTSFLRVSITRPLPQFSDIQFVECLGQEEASKVRDSLLSWLCYSGSSAVSTHADELTRAGLFDLLAEVVICGRQGGSRPLGLLRLLLSPSHAAGSGVADGRNWLSGESNRAKGRPGEGDGGNNHSNTGCLESIWSALEDISVSGVDGVFMADDLWMTSLYVCVIRGDWIEWCSGCYD